MQTIVLATQNLGKLKEITHVLSLKHIQIQSLSAYTSEQANETGLTFIENALIKARFASKMSGLPAIADDSGLVVDALAGRPGLYSARYAGENASDQAHYEKLLSEMREIPNPHRNAHFCCTLVYLRHETDPAPEIFQGIWHGVIYHKPLGTEGFGYDPIFYLPESRCTAAQLPLEQKNKMSHRGQALQKLKQFFDEIFKI